MWGGGEHFVLSRRGRGRVQCDLPIPRGAVGMKVVTLNKQGLGGVYIINVFDNKRMREKETLFCFSLSETPTGFLAAAREREYCVKHHGEQRLTPINGDTKPQGATLNNNRRPPHTRRGEKSNEWLRRWHDELFGILKVERVSPRETKVPPKTQTHTVFLSLSPQQTIY